MAEAAIVSLLSGFSVKANSFLYDNAWSRHFKAQPVLELRKETYLTFEGWCETIDKVNICHNRYIIPKQVQANDVAARSIMLILQYWNILHMKQDHESRKLVVQLAGYSNIIVKSFGSNITLGQHYLRELFVDLASLIVSAPAMRTAYNQFPFLGCGVVQTPAAHVVQLLIMRSQRHMVSVLEGVREHIDASNVKLIGADVCLQLFERSVFWETLFSPTPRHLNETERTTKILSLTTANAERSFMSEMMQIPIDALQKHGVIVIKDLTTFTSCFDLIVSNFDESKVLLDILAPYEATVIPLDSDKMKSTVPEVEKMTMMTTSNAKLYMIRLSRESTLVNWLYKNENHQKMSADEEKRMRHGVSSFQQMKTAHMDRMEDWGRNMVQYIKNKNKIIERNNPRVRILRETVEILFYHSKISSAKHDVSKSLRYTVDATVRTLMNTIGLVMSLMKFNADSLKSPALDDMLASVQNALAEHWWTPEGGAKLASRRELGIRRSYSQI